MTVRRERSRVTVRRGEEREEWSDSEERKGGRGERGVE